jgi:hypothetical protein
MVTKSEALCRKLVDRALAGDARSLDQLTGLLPHVDEYSPPDVEQRPPTKEELEAKEREFDAKIREIYGLRPLRGVLSPSMADKMRRKIPTIRTAAANNYEVAANK